MGQDMEDFSISPMRQPKEENWSCLYPLFYFMDKGTGMDQAIADSKCKY